MILLQSVNHIRAPQSPTFFKSLTLLMAHEFWNGGSNFCIVGPKSVDDMFYISNRDVCKAASGKKYVELRVSNTLFCGFRYICSWNSRFNKVLKQMLFCKWETFDFTKCLFENAVVAQRICHHKTPEWERILFRRNPMQWSHGRLCGFVQM